MADVITTDYFNEASLRQLIAIILQEAKQQGATSAEVSVSVNKGFAVTARMREIETVEYNQDKNIEITVYFGQRCGLASLSDVRIEAIRSAVQAACHIARFTDEDMYSGLADPALLSPNYPQIDMYTPWNISVTDAIDMALECEAIGLDKDKRICNSEGVTVGTIEVWNAYGNSHGFIGVFPVTRHEISSALIAKKGDDMQRDYSYTVASDPGLLDSIQTVAKQAVERTVRRLGAKRLSTRQVPVLFAAEQARGLIGHFISAISGGNIYRKSSFLVDHIGQAVFPKHITLDERPFLPKKLGSCPFDDDGLVTRPNVFVKEGVLQSYVLSVYSAKKLGLQPTANSGGVHNLFISTGQNGFDGMLKRLDTGLLVTELMGDAVSIITGDYSRGASGFWVERGEIQYPVEEITIAGRLQDMYGNLVEVGNDVDPRGNIQTGSVLLESMMIAGE